MAWSLKNRYFGDWSKAQQTAVMYAGTGISAYVFGTARGYCVSAEPPPFNQQHYRVAPRTTTGIPEGGPA